MEMLLLESCVTSHFERELAFEHLNKWRMIVHMQEVVFLRILDCIVVKIDLVDRVVIRAQKKVRLSILNDILPIRNWAPLNNGHWLIRAQA